MKGIARSFAKTAGMMLAGAALGALAVLIYFGASVHQLLSVSFWSKNPASKKGAVADACPQGTVTAESAASQTHQDDDVFFLTCGGIY